MRPTLPGWAAPLLAAAGALAIAVGADRAAPVPSADVSSGSEDPFTSGLFPREIPPGGHPQRWTGPRTMVRFRDVPKGPAVLEVALRGHRSDVAVALDGVVLGRLPPGQQAGAFDVLLPVRGRHEVELRVEPFEAGDGRRLGALLQSVRLWHAPPSLPSGLLAAEFALPAAAVAAAALVAGLGPWGASAWGLVLAALQALLLWPQGLLRSGYAPVLAALLAASAWAAALFARWCARRVGGAGRWAFAALMAALVVQGMLASSPLMVVSDAVFHANNLTRVTGGDYFITSVTQHARPFQFPYGVSFYVLLAPLRRAGLDGVTLVRVGASLAAVAASAVLFRLLLFRSAAACAGLAVIVLQLLPITLDMHSYGNLSNVFGQAATTAFFAWWAALAPGGGAEGALLYVLGSLGHFSSAVVLAVLAAALLWMSRPDVGRARATGLLVGLVLTAGYFACFLPMIARQLPRLIEGGGQGRGASQGTLAALRLQLLGPLTQWGLPALVLAWFGRPRRGSGDALGRNLLAYWLAGAVLALLAVVSPLEVRYVYALSVPLAVAAGTGAAALWARGRGGRVAAALLVLAQAALAGANALDALLRRYR